jgi:hypothetical protein
VPNGSNQFNGEFSADPCCEIPALIPFSGKLDLDQFPGLQGLIDGVQNGWLQSPNPDLHRCPRPVGQTP